MSALNVSIDESWKAVLKDEFAKPYFPKIKKAIQASKSQGKTVYPPGPEIFNAFNLTPFDQVRVVILGQDPYHGEGQAMGLCFSVKRGGSCIARQDRVAPFYRCSDQGYI